MVSSIFKPLACKTLPFSPRRSWFNLVEVTLAIAIIGLGAASIMSLFPIGLQATRDAVADNYTSDMATQFLKAMERKCLESGQWAAYIATSDVTGNIRGTAPDATSIADTNTSIPSTATTLGDNITLYATSSGWSNGNNVYGILQRTGTVNDFTAHVQVWKSPVQANYYDGTNWATYNISYTAAAKLNILVSWPIEKPFSKRQKAYYTLEIFNN